MEGTIPSVPSETLNEVFSCPREMLAVNFKGLSKLEACGGRVPKALSALCLTLQKDNQLRMKKRCLNYISCGQVNVLNVDQMLKIDLLLMQVYMRDRSLS